MILLGPSVDKAAGQVSGIRARLAVAKSENSVNRTFYSGPTCSGSAISASGRAIVESRLPMRQAARTTEVSDHGDSRHTWAETTL